VTARTAASHSSGERLQWSPDTKPGKCFRGPNPARSGGSLHRSEMSGVGGEADTPRALPMRRD
jgi:hypothetical protein